jgi:hypothetical protein
MYRFLLFIGFLFQAPGSLAQKKNIVVWGRVTNTEGQSVAAATVKTAAGNLTISDLGGFYRLKLSPADSVLIVSCVGFAETRRNVASMLRDTAIGDRVRINFALRKSVNTLWEVTIRPGGEPEQIGDKKFFIDDYELVGENIILLVSKKEKYRLWLLDAADSLLIDQELDMKALSLFRDCMGNVYVYTKDTVYQINLDFPHISLFAATPVDYFEMMVKPCTAEKNGSYFFEAFGIHRQSVAHYLYRKDQPRKLLKLIRDERSESHAHAYYVKTFLAYHAPVDALTDEQLDARFILRQSRAVFEQEAFYRLILSKPVYDPLKIAGDSVLVFDHFQDTLHFYDLGGNPMGACPITYHKSKGWVPEIIMDEEKKAAFVCYTLNGITELHRLSLTDCRLAEKHVIASQIFPEKIRIRGGWVYYLHKDNKAEWANRHLFRRKLEAGLSRW